jgi:putative ABC transport system permease protein
MTPILHLTLKSVWNRRLTVALTVASIALSVALLLGVERVRHQARDSFANTISGTDLIVGARSGPVQLLLYSVFHLGNATNNISMQSLDALAAHRAVRWVVPIALGDSHRGFRVIGTQPAFFERYRFGVERGLELAAGRAFSGTLDGLFEAVVGAEVAARLAYQVGSPIIVAHGAGGGELNLAEHADKPFTVVGVLARTGTPLDRSVLVSLPAIEAIHLDWQGGAPIPGLSIAAEEARKFDLTPKNVTAALVGLKARAAVFQVQRFVNEFKAEPLLAILPGATLQELWGLLAVAEQALFIVSALVVVVGLAGLVAVIVAGLNERRRELAILRALGASPRQIFVLLASESLLLTIVGCGVGLALLYVVSAVLAPWLLSAYGLQMTFALPSLREGLLLLAVLGAGLLASLFPAWRAYRLSLADGMSVRA